MKLLKKSSQVKDTTAYRSVTNCARQRFVYKSSTSFVQAMFHALFSSWSSSGDVFLAPSKDCRTESEMVLWPPVDDHAFRFVRLRRRKKESRFSNRNDQLRGSVGPLASTVDLWCWVRIPFCFNFQFLRELRQLDKNPRNHKRKTRIPTTNK